MDMPVVLHQMQLREVIIEKISCRRIGDFHAGAGPQVNFVVRAKTLNNYEAYGYLIVKIFFDEEPKVFSLELVVRGKLINKKATNRTMLKRFVESQSLPLLLPWAREAIASLTRQMGLPPLLLPLIDVFATLRESDRAKHEEAKGAYGEAFKDEN